MEVTGKFRFIYLVGIKEVCLDAWLIVLGFSVRIVGEGAK